ncbi:MAG: hypothetical protein IPM84_20295 [Anaerolineae bacterium]|nr:hypothetical protein [Anaerolineae bacterium]
MKHLMNSYARLRDAPSPPVPGRCWARGHVGRLLLALDLPQTDSAWLAITETDGCFVDGVSAVTGCYVGRRTLRVEDFGKVAAVFVGHAASGPFALRRGSTCGAGGGVCA